MAWPALRLLPHIKATHLRFLAFSLSGAIPVSAPSPAGAPNHLAQKSPLKCPATSAGFSAPLTSSACSSSSSRSSLSQHSPSPSSRLSVSPAMASAAPPFAPVPKPVDASNGIEHILAFWLGDWAVTADKNPDVSDEVRMQKRPIWFMKNDALDNEIRDAFGPLLEQGKEGKLESWEETPLGTAALVILLDQFPRNTFRGSPDSFAADPKALEVAKRSIEKGFDKKVPGPIRNFIYLPFMHSEDLATSQRGIELYSAFAKELPEGAVKVYAEATLKFSIMHTDVIKKFGRFPHRNAILGRESTPEEIEYLKEGGGF